MWQSSMRSLKKCLFHSVFTCYRDRGAFDAPDLPIHSLSLIFVYLFRYFLPSNLFSLFVFVVPQQIRLMEGSQNNKDLER